MNNPLVLIDSVVELAEQAGKAILEVYRRDFDVEHKDDSSPLTEADMAAHRCIVAGLEKFSPRWPVLSEESASIPWSQRQQWPCYWLVDPLDGTREFVKRNGEFTVNIALIENHQPVLGVVHAPVLDTSWYALRAGNAFVRDESGSASITVCSPAPAPLRVAASRSHLDPRTAAVLHRIGESEPIALGSSMKFCRLAEGRLDFYPRFGPTSEWDTAAAQCVLEAAGGAVIGLDGQPLRYNTKDSLLNPDFLALGDPNLPWRDWLG